jgi:hypothetical protein
MSPGVPLDLNRSALLVTPRAPFLHWAERHGNGVPYPVGGERTVYLLPSYDLQDEVEEIVDHYHDLIFETELEDWVRDESAWPSDRNYALFREWFDVEIHSVVLDLVAGEPLVEDEDGPNSGNDREP